MVKELYLMRHGQTLFNTQKRVQGACDSPLTTEGIQQAQAAKVYFEENGIRFDYAYSSTQERATDTLKIVTDAPYQQLKGIKEMSFGTFEAREEELLPKFRPGSNSFEDLLVPFGGEDIADVGVRVHETVQDIIKEAHDTVLAVSHGAALWAYLLKEHENFPDNARLTNCAIAHFVVDGETVDFVKLVDPVTQAIYPAKNL